jgi:hypothetical protein
MYSVSKVKLYYLFFVGKFKNRLFVLATFQLSNVLITTAMRVEGSTP